VDRTLGDIMLDDTAPENIPRPAGSRRGNSVGAFGALALLAVASVAAATPMDLILGFSSLPSAQGWTYTPSGAHAGATESSVFWDADGALVQNTLGLSNGISGGSIFYVRSGGVTANETKRIVVRARCLAVQGSTNATDGQGGFIYGFTTGSVQYAFGLTDTRLTVLQPSGTVLVPGTFDNTAFHEYIFQWAPPGSYQLYRDGVQVFSGSGGFTFSASRVYFGDGTGGANAKGETSYFRFSQDLATPVQATSWGRLKQLYR
jgi:hypothetical protein